MSTNTSDAIALDSYTVASKPYSGASYAFVNAGSTQSLTVGGRSLLTVSATDGAVLVDVDHNGRATFGETYEPCEATKIFWKTLGGFIPTKLARLEYENEQLKKQIEELKTTSHVTPATMERENPEHLHTGSSLSRLGTTTSDIAVVISLMLPADVVVVFQPVNSITITGTINQTKNDLIESYDRAMKGVI
jgi:hypothetical protein